MREETCKLSRWELLKRRLNNLTPAAFWEKFERFDNAILLDVRTEPEFRVDGLPGARNVDYLAHNLWDQLECLDRDRPYFVYCRSGRRSVRVCTLMKNGGFPEVYNLNGGLIAWQARKEERGAGGSSE